MVFSSIYRFGSLVLVRRGAAPPPGCRPLSGIFAASRLREAGSSACSSRLLDLAVELGEPQPVGLSSQEREASLERALRRLGAAISQGSFAAFEVEPVKPLTQVSASAAAPATPVVLAQATPAAKPPDQPNLVTPRVEAEYLVVLLEQGLSKHQAATETPIRADATRVEVRVDQSWPAGHPFKTGGKLKASPAGVEAFLDAACTRPLPGNLAAGAPLGQAQLSSGTTLYLRGKTAGRFSLSLELDPTGDGMVQAQVTPPLEMGVVKLELLLHQHDVAAVAALKVNPDVDPVASYHTALQNLAIPAQKAVTEAERVQGKRLLHAQRAASFGRAKLIVKKLDAAQWPPGTGDYEITLTDASESGAVAVCADEWDGPPPAPLRLKVAALQAAEKVCWVEGQSASKPGKLARLDLGLDRPAGGLAKQPKGRGDVARFTVVQLQDVKVDYTPQAGQPVAWDDPQGRFYVNLKLENATFDGRKITIAAQLSEKIAGVTVHFVLAPDADNLKAANWGVALPATWKWKDVPAALKHKDHTNRDDFLHVSAQTDADGKVSKELVLSRFGGDLFHLGCYVEQDPHLAKYVRGHAVLEKRVPVLGAKTVRVWRRFWYELVKVAGLAFPALTKAAQNYDLVKAEMVGAPDVNVTRATVNAMNPRAIYPRYMIEVNGGNADALVVSDTNKGQFFGGVAAAADKPVKFPVLICDAQWDAGRNSGVVPAINMPATAFPVDLATSELVIDPPLQPGALLVAGTWQAAEPNPAGGWMNIRGGNLAAGDVGVNPARASLRHVRVNLPAALAGVTPQTRVIVSGLVVQGADGPYLGEYSRATGRLLSVYDSTQARDFQNTITHELGHALHQVADGPASGLPAHPHRYASQGHHCRHGGNICVMYESGPIAASLDRYCDDCHPYLLVQDMSRRAT